MSNNLSYDSAILGMGNPLLDIFSEAPKEIMEKYGITLNNTITAEEKHLPLYEELIAKYPVQYIAGGATLNSIRVAQWMLQTPGSTTYFGAIGSDKFGDILEQCAMDDGVRTIFQKTDGASTGTCAVLVHGGERALVPNLGAASTFKVSHLETEEAKTAIQKAKILYSAGFFLKVSVESVVSICKHLVEENKIYCMNLSASFVIKSLGEQLATALTYADFVFGNESEALAYGEVKGLGSDLSTIALKMAALPKASGCRPRVVVFILKASSTLVCHQGKVTTYPVEPLPKHLLVDTNGSGDAFVGGFLSQLVQGKDISECVRAGHFASRVVMQRSGCTFPKECNFV